MITRQDLTDQEVDALCEWLTQNAEKARYLAQLGLHVERRPNGRPLVMRAHAEHVLAGSAAANDATQTHQTTTPAVSGNRDGLVLLFGRRVA